MVSQLASSQFAPTPRFGKHKPTYQRLPSPPKPALVQALRASIRTTEAVEDKTTQDDDDEMLDNEQIYAIPTTEDSDAVAPWTNDLTMSPKRRRLEDAESLSSPERNAFKLPQTPASRFAKAMPRVPLFPTQETVSTQSTELNAPRPAFLRSSIAPPEPSEPLPDAFSPHRRGQKFVPGGMAATMQQWVLEAGQSAVQSRKGQGYLKGEDYVMHARVESQTGDGPQVVKGRTGSGEGVILVLAGNGHIAGDRRQDLALGTVLGVRAPSWNIELDGNEYAIAVDWRILQ